MYGVVLLLLGATVAKVEALPLSASDGTRAVTLEIPPTAFLHRAKEASVETGLLIFLDADGNKIGVNINIRARGKSRPGHRQIARPLMTFAKSCAPTSGRTQLRSGSPPKCV
jgi:hypothetical protein